MGPRLDCHDSVPASSTSSHTYQRRRGSSAMESGFSSSPHLALDSSEEMPLLGSGHPSSSNLRSSHQSSSNLRPPLLASESQSSLANLSSDLPSQSHPALSNNATNSSNHNGGGNSPGTRNDKYTKISLQKSFFHFSKWKPRLVVAWTLHFVACIAVTVYGSLANGGKRKYIPLDVEKLGRNDCEKAFVDVFSSSIDEPGALVCCPGESVNAQSICNPPPSYLMFARRLSRFPDAWLLPLFPLLVRGVWQLCQTLHGSADSRLSTNENVYAKRRFYLYMILIQMRGWVLYMTFDEIEEILVSAPETDCWYEQYLHPGYSSCQGRTTDFSDHMVLYFAQILPIALTEVLHCFAVPFWSTKGSDAPSLLSRPSDQYTRLVPLLFMVWMANLYLVTFLGAYKTAAYFHTGFEVVIGFLVSLLIQIPLCLLQCTSFFPETREYFYGVFAAS